MLTRGDAFAAESGLDAERPNHAVGKIEVLTRPIPPLTTLPRYVQVRAVHLALESWMIDAGLPTPTPQGQKGRRAANVRNGDQRFVWRAAA